MVRYIQDQTESPFDDPEIDWIYRFLNSARVFKQEMQQIAAEFGFSPADLMKLAAEHGPSMLGNTKSYNTHMLRHALQEAQRQNIWERCVINWWLEIRRVSEQIELTIDVDICEELYELLDTDRVPRDHIDRPALDQARQRLEFLQKRIGSEAANKLAAITWEMQRFLWLDEIPQRLFQ